MNLEAINKWLDEEYGCSFTKLEELHNFYFEKYCDLQQENKKLNGTIQTYDILLKANVEENKHLDEVNCKLRKTNEQLKDNWIKLKKWLNNFHKLSEFEQWEIVNKIQELEKGNNHE
jgi:hypothetical protein